VVHDVLAGMSFNSLSYPLAVQPQSGGLPPILALVRKTLIMHREFKPTAFFQSKTTRWYALPSVHARS
jgi:hypothetical protein